MGNVPKLRFPEFSGEWSTRKFNDLIDIIEERAGTKKYTLMSVTAGVGLVPQIEKFGREIAGNAYKNYYVIKRGDFAYNKSATKQFPEGYIAMLNGHEEAALPDSIFVCFRITGENTYPKIFDHLFHANYHGSWLRKFIAVGARAHGSLNIDTKHLLELPVALPSYQEQQKIANFLSLIGKKITKQDEKVAALEQYKKWLMQKIFAREIRFKDDNGKDYPVWEKKSLSQVSYCLDSLRKPMNSAERALIKGNVPYYGANGIQGYINKYIFDEDLVLIAEDGGSFESFRDKPIAQFVTGKSWVNNHAHVLRAKGNSRFLFYSLVHKDIRKYICGTSRSKLTKENMIKILVPSPTIPEQTKIANLLSLYDRKIEKEKTKLEVLREQKKGLLQQMFV